MKKLLFITLASLTIGFGGLCQETKSKLALTMNYEVSSDWGIMSAWYDYGVRNGFGIGLTVNPDSKSSWLVKYGFSQGQATYASYEFFEAINEFPDYNIYSKNHLNFNSLVFGWKRQVFSSHSFRGYFSFDLGYNLATRSKVIGFPPRPDGTFSNPNDLIKLVTAGYDHSIRGGLALGTTIRIKEYLDYYIEGGITGYSKLVNINTIQRPSSFLKLQTGFIVKI